METIIVLAGMALIGLLVWQGERLRIMPVPTGPRVRSAALRLMAAANPAPAHIVELGAGWGGMTRLLARYFPMASITAYERSALPYMVSRLVAGRADVRRADIFTVNLAQADIVFCYLSPWHMAQLAPKFTDELKAGAIVVSVSFPLSGRIAQAQETIPGLANMPVRLYRF